MKKLFTLSIAIFCVVAINAQITESGNGFVETFTYDDGTVWEDGMYEGIAAEWFGGAVIDDGKLKWELPFEEEPESWFGMWELNMDLSENTEITFQYQFPLDSDFGIWIETEDGGGEVWPDDFFLGVDELQSYTIDVSTFNYFETEDPMDLTKPILEIWIGSYSEVGGTFYLDSLVIGDGTFTGISSKPYKSGLQVYPNPATDEFRIDADIKSLAVYNSIGQMVHSEENYQNGSSVDISELRNGLYIIRADDYTHKLMVE